MPEVSEHGIMSHVCVRVERNADEEFKRRKILKGKKENHKTSNT